MTLPFGMDVALGGLPAAALLAIPLIVVFAYTIFGLTGFGSGIVAAPLMANLFPLPFVVPLQLLLDFTAFTALGSRVRASVRWREIAWIAPFMLAGMALGLTLLVNLPRNWLLVLFGAFVLVYGLLGLFGRAPSGRFAQWWVAPISTFGGVISALFGTGGPVYVIYLSRRIDDPGALRATIATVVMLSALARLIVFGVAGLFLQPGLVALAVLLLPFLALGVWIGTRLHHRLPAARVRRIVYALLVASGVTLVARGL